MIIKHINKHYLEKQRNKKARNGKLYVSFRQIYFEFKGYEPEKHKPETQRAFENGDKFHQRMMVLKLSPARLISLLKTFLAVE